MAVRRLDEGVSLEDREHFSLIAGVLFAALIAPGASKGCSCPIQGENPPWPAESVKRSTIVGRMRPVIRLNWSRLGFAVPAATLPAAIGFQGETWLRNLQALASGPPEFPPGPKSRSFAACLVRRGSPVPGDGPSLTTGAAAHIGAPAGRAPVIGHGGDHRPPRGVGCIGDRRFGDRCRIAATELSTAEIITLRVLPVSWNLRPNCGCGRYPGGAPGPARGDCRPGGRNPVLPGFSSRGRGSARGRRYSGCAPAVAARREGRRRPRCLVTRRDIRAMSARIRLQGGADLTAAKIWYNV